MVVGDAELLELARFARNEDQRIKRQWVEMERTGSDSVYEALFR
jgi:hypothetical protein